jgi:hypothetical protein
LMEHIHNNLGNVPQKLLFQSPFFSINGTLKNGLTAEIYRVFITRFSFFCGTLPSDPPNFIKKCPV